MVQIQYDIEKTESNKKNYEKVYLITSQRSTRQSIYN